MFAEISIRTRIRVEIEPVAKSKISRRRLHTGGPAHFSAVKPNVDEIPVETLRKAELFPLKGKSIFREGEVWEASRVHCGIHESAQFPSVLRSRRIATEDRQRTISTRKLLLPRRVGAVIVPHAHRRSRHCAGFTQTLRTRLHPAGRNAQDGHHAEYPA